MPLCEGRRHKDITFLGGLIAPAMVPPMEGTQIHNYNGEDHYFCSDRCFQNWIFNAQKDAGFDVDAIQITKDGKAIFCAECDDPILYGKVTQSRVFPPKMSSTLVWFCCEDHYTTWVARYHRERHGDDSNDNDT